MEATLTYRENLEQTIEYKKLVDKLENEISKKDDQIKRTLKLYDELKAINESNLKENKELKLQIEQLFKDIETLKQKYREKIEKIKKMNTQTKEDYEKKIKEYSQYNEIVLRNKITNELDLQNKINLRDKEIELEALREKIINLEKENIKLANLLDEKELEYKRKMDENRNQMNENIQKIFKKLNLTNDDDIYNKKSINKSTDDDIYKTNIEELKSQIEYYKADAKYKDDQLKKLQSKYSGLDNKELYSNSKIYDELENEKSLNKSLTDRYNNMVNHCQYLENEIDQLQNKLKIAEDNNSFLLSQKELMLKTNMQLQNNITSLNQDLDKLKLLILKNQEEYEQKLKNNNDNISS